jgi:hypothetical protein
VGKSLLHHHLNGSVDIHGLTRGGHSDLLLYNFNALLSANEIKRLIMMIIKEKNKKNCKIIVDGNPLPVRHDGP